MYTEQQEFKKHILTMKAKSDKEIFDKAKAKAYHHWTETKVCLPFPLHILTPEHNYDQVPSEITTLFEDHAISPEALHQNSSPFFHLLIVLKKFTNQSETHTPANVHPSNMKSDTTNYIHLQRWW
ncbi:hypothetical protein J3R82DRAFT_11125 [Butyriboletus roseoflavus]|nr:hypothetical protein J3R82DRAFT_11125 [Butyriboletus roseoflavus]